MADHHPDAEKVLAVGMGTSSITWALGALSAAGLTVVSSQELADLRAELDRSGRAFRILAGYTLAEMES